MHFGLTQTSSAMKTISRVQRPFISFNRTVLAALNAFLKDAMNPSPGFAFRIDILCSTCNGPSGLFFEDGIHGILEASDHDSIDYVLPFLVSKQ